MLCSSLPSLCIGGGRSVSALPLVTGFLSLAAHVKARDTIGPPRHAAPRPQGLHVIRNRLPCLERTAPSRRVPAFWAIPVAENPCA